MNGTMGLVVWKSLGRRKEGYMYSSRILCIQRPRTWDCMVCPGGAVEAR